MRSFSADEKLLSANNKVRSFFSWFKPVGRTVNLLKLRSNNFRFSDCTSSSGKLFSWLCPRSKVYKFLAWPTWRGNPVSWLKSRASVLSSLGLNRVPGSSRSWFCDKDKSNPSCVVEAIGRKRSGVPGRSRGF